MKELKRTTCINGELKVGDLVLSTPEDDYSCLVGRVTDIKLLGDSDRDTENSTDDVYVDFTVFEYSQSRIIEIEERLTDHFHDVKTMDEAGLDMLIMNPLCLIRINEFDVGGECVNAFLKSGMVAAEYCYNFLRNHPIADIRRDTGDEIIRVPYVSVWDGDSIVETFAMLYLNTGKVTNIEAVDAPNHLNSCEREYILVDDIEVEVITDEVDDSRWITLNEEIIAAGSGGEH